MGEQPTSDPVHDLIIVSDMHLGEGRPDGRRYAPTEDFFHDASFARFLAYLESVYANPNDLVLVLNGDIFDFLTITAIPSEEEASARGFVISSAEKKFGLNGTESKSIYKLDVIARGHRVFFGALSKFAKKGYPIEILRGNHDQELFYPGIQERLLQILADAPNGASMDQLRSQVTFHQLFYIEKGRIHIEHGHQYDASNSIRFPLHPVYLKKDKSRDGYIEETMDYPLGSIFVKFFYNRVRRLDPYAPRVVSPEQYMDFIRRYNVFDVWRVYKDHYPYFIAAMSPFTDVGSSESAEADNVVSPQPKYAVPTDADIREYYDEWDKLKISPESASKAAMVKKAMAPVFRRAMWAGVFAFTVLYLWILGFLLIQNIPWNTANAFLTSLFAVATIGGGLWTWVHFRKKVRSRSKKKKDTGIEATLQLAKLSGAKIVAMGHTHRVDVQMVGEGDPITFVNSGTWTSVNNPWYRIMRDARRLTFIKVAGDKALLHRWNDDAQRFDDVPLFHLDENEIVNMVDSDYIPELPEPNQEHSWIPSPGMEPAEDEDVAELGGGDV